MTKDKFNDLRRRMHSHTDVNGIAVVVLTAKELQELLDIVDNIECEKVAPELYCMNEPVKK